MDSNFGEIVEFFIDSGLSGKDTKRPALQKLLKAVQDKEVNLVVSTELSRISRNMKDFAGIWEMFKANNCSFQSLRENFDTTTAAGEMVLYTIANIAQFERRQVAERVAANMNARAQRGLYNGGPVPFGYDLDELKVGYLKKHLDHSKVVEKIFEVFLKTENVAATAKYLNDHLYKHAASMRGGGPRTRVANFTTEIVRRIISNKAYIAVKCYKENKIVKEAKSVWEPIVNKILFNKAQEILSKGNHQRKKHSENRYPYLLTSLVFCKTCGDVMCGKSAWGRNGKVGYYEHGWAVRKEANLSKKTFNCSPCRVPAKKLEQLVLDELYKLLSSEKLLNDLFSEAKFVSSSNTSEKERQTLKIKESSYSKQLEALAARLSELPVNVDAKVIYQQMEKLQDLKVQVAKKHQEITPSSEVKAAELSDVVEFAKLVKKVLLDDSNPELKALIISKFIKKIEVGTNSVTIYYYVAEIHFKRELALAGSSFNLLEKKFCNFGSNNLTNGGIAPK